MTRIAFLGTGLLGGALAEAAARRGDQVTAWNRTPAKAQALAPHGVRAAPTPAEAVQGARRVHLVLKDDAVVEDVIAAARPGLAPDAILVDHTTTHPALTGARSRRLNAEGIRYLHCPVFIGPAAAREGQGTVLASGPRALFDDVKDDLAQMGTRLEYFGERPDLAAVFKLCGNAYIIGVASVVADSLSIAAGSGVPAADALRVIEFFNPSAIISGRGRSMVTGVRAPGFELDMARKDVQLMLDSVGGRPLATLPQIAARMDALLAEGYGAEDLAIIGKDAVR